VTDSFAFPCEAYIIDRSAVSDLSNTLLNTPDSVFKLLSPKSNVDTEFDYLDVELARYQRKYPNVTLEEIFTNPNLTLDSTEIQPTQGDPNLDVTKLSPKEIIFLANNVDDINRMEALEHIRSTYVSSAPNVKLYYPEPFIASASFIHNDIGFIHILQYQFWL
jgi:hypothetical protein